MERTIDVTIRMNEVSGIADVFFFDNGSGDGFSYCDIRETNDETAKEIGWEILTWVDMMRNALKYCEEADA